MSRHFLRSLDKSLSDEDEFIKDQKSSQSTPGEKTQHQNSISDQQEIAESQFNGLAKAEESGEEIVASARQSPHSEFQASDNDKPQPKGELQERAEGSPNPNDQIEEELRQKAKRECGSDHGPAEQVPVTIGSPEKEAEPAPTSSRHSSPKEKESSVEPPLPLDEARVASIETPVIIVDEELSDGDFSPAFQERLQNVAEEDCEDNADYILKTRFAPMTDQQDFINALTKMNPQQRPMDVLYALAESTQAALKLWQDEYLTIDKRTAPHANIPRKPATGARNPIDPEIFEDMREAEIYGYTFDPKRIGHQNPFTQRSARGLRGRELRDRRKHDILESLGLSEDDAGAGPGRRTRKPTQKVEGNFSAAATPEMTRKRGIASMTPDTDAGGSGPPRKRSRRPNAAPHGDLLNPRIREMRAGSALTTTTEEDTEADDGEGDGDLHDAAFRGSAGPSSLPKRRGRPKGSKNVSKRPDAGIKKGPRASWTKKLLPTPLGGIDESRGGTPSAAATDVESPEKTYDAQPHPPYTGPSGPSTLSTYPTQDYFGSSPMDANAATAVTKAPRKSSAGSLMRKSGKVSGQGQASGLGILKPEAEGAQKRRQQAKSEKRSKSMTLWWAERKKRQAEANVQRLQGAGPEVKGEFIPRSGGVGDLDLLQDMGSMQEHDGKQGLQDGDVKGKDTVFGSLEDGAGQARSGEMAMQ